MSNRTRLELDIGDAALKQLDVLQEQTRSSSRAETVRKALEVLDYIENARRRGGRVVLELPGEASGDEVRRFDITTLHEQ